VQTLPLFTLNALSVVVLITCSENRQTDRHPFNGVFSRTTSVSWHRKGYTNLDFNEARDDGVVVASAAPYANYLHLVLDR